MYNRWRISGVPFWISQSTPFYNYNNNNNSVSHTTIISAILLHTNKLAIKIAGYFSLYPLRIARFQRALIPGLDRNPFRIYKKKDFRINNIIILIVQ